MKNNNHIIFLIYEYLYHLKKKITLYHRYTKFCYLVFIIIMCIKLEDSIMECDVNAIRVI